MRTPEGSQTAHSDRLLLVVCRVVSESVQDPRVRRPVSRVVPVLHNRPVRPSSVVVRPVVVSFVVALVTAPVPSRSLSHGPFCCV